MVGENRVLRMILTSKRYEVTEGRIKLHNEKLPNFYCVANIDMMIKTRRLRWAGHMARTDRIRKYAELGGKM
jgi:hypothetical protein